MKRILAALCCVFLLTALCPAFAESAEADPRENSYQIALNMENEQSYALAARLFAKLAGYRDSDAHWQNCQYQQARILEEEEK